MRTASACHNRAVPIEIPAAGFAYIADPRSPFSNGVIALDGHVLRRVHFRTPLPLREGLAFSAGFIRRQDRPLTSMAACELRIPARLTRPGFSAFNADYVAALRTHGFTAGDSNPMARSNMAPRFNPPAEPVLAAFTFAVPQTAASASRDFVISGKPEIAANPNCVIAPGDVSPAGMRQKAEFVIDELRRRVNDLGGRWADITGAHIYTRQSLDPIIDILAANGLVDIAPALIPGEPPVEGYGDFHYEFEMDVRAISLEQNT